ncbi:collagen alpha-1(XIII) chain-like [Pleurodeles waltl]|uniref:collagen alpha-1(XIII) chain-like n=1 Tax=Pleurodeles waltl TaxID=8319 RepID=UPI00370963D4
MKSWEGMEEERGCRTAAGSAWSQGCRAPHRRTEEARKAGGASLVLGCGCAAVSLLSLVVSLLAQSGTSDLQTRVLSLEDERRAQLSALLSADQMETTILGRVDQLLEEKFKSHLPKLREVRDAPQKCSCPPGPPGAKGKRGHNGEQASHGNIEKSLST